MNRSPRLQGNMNRQCCVYAQQTGVQETVCGKALYAIYGKLQPM